MPRPRHALLAIALAGGFAGTAGPARAQPPGEVRGPTSAAGDDRRLEMRVDSLLAQLRAPGAPGCAVAVGRDGDVVLERAYGLADLGHGVALTPGSVFHVASIAKQVTAAAVLLLAQEGRLALDDDVRTHLPELPAMGGPPVTLRHLLHHTSGLRDQFTLLEAAGWRLFQDRVTDVDVMRLLLRQRGVVFAPGARMAYTNTNYTLLAQVVSRRSGQPFAAFARERLFEPLGLVRTRFRDDYDVVVPGLAAPYVRASVPTSAPGAGPTAGAAPGAAPGGAYRAQETNLATVGATSLLTTAGELVRWTEALHAGRVGGPALRERMLAPGRLADGTALDYAAGLIVDTYRGLATIGHNGSDAGYLADVVHFPGARLTVAGLCNSRTRSAYRLTRRVADIYLAERLAAAPPVAAPPGAPPAPAAPGPAGASVSAAALAAYAGRYYSPELDVVWEIATAGDTLVLHRPKEVVPLAALGDDRFRWPWAALRFVRGRSGGVAGLVLAHEALGELRFERLTARP